MEAIRKIIDDATAQIIIDLPEQYHNRTIEVIVLPLEKKEQSKKYDFSDIVGKLKWEGDAVVEQRKLRDEWD